MKLENFERAKELVRTREQLQSKINHFEAVEDCNIRFNLYDKNCNDLLNNFDFPQCSRLSDDFKTLIFHHAFAELKVALSEVDAEIETL